jgi:hypothetical protein
MSLSKADLPPDGTSVRARVSRWADAQANNAEPYPDPALPSLDGVEEWQTGPLTSHEVHLADFNTAYLRCLVNGYDVDPESVEAVSRELRHR